MVNLGTARTPSERMLNAAWDAGVRYLDTADCYDQGASERRIAEWLGETGRRKEIFLVTKDHPDTPDQWVSMLDTRLEALKTDYIDLYFIHMLGGGFRGGGVEEHRDWPKSKEWAAAADKIRKSGKARFVGFSTHTTMDLRIALMNNAAEGGWSDAVMVAYDPKTVRDNAEFNKSLDACHKAGVGLICMKEMRSVGNAPEYLPEFEEMGLTQHQAVLHAVWTDERMASICSDMPSMKILEENSAAARKFKPLDAKAMAAVLGLYDRLAQGYCNACDGRCARAGGTKAALGDITRALSYFERDGMREEGKRLYASLTPEERDWHGADLAAASEACVCKLDFAALLRRAEEKLA
jgi:predicted aldo/keto reductase-like oxidoreductase